ncbi:MAG: DinB family protein [Gemmatimonadota bacterium]|nr:DinB family protein [Gemmatimonadota bacterium]
MTERSTTAEQIAQRLALQFGAIPAILADREPADLERRPPSGGWCAREQLAHLARYHEVTLERLSRILTESRPRFERYRAEDDPEFLPWLTCPADEIIRRVGVLRARLSGMVQRLSPEQLGRVGVHPVFGEMPMSLWLEFFLVHEGHHLYALFQRARERPAVGRVGEGERL